MAKTISLTNQKDVELGWIYDSTKRIVYHPERRTQYRLSDYESREYSIKFLTKDDWSLYRTEDKALNNFVYNINVEKEKMFHISISADIEKIGSEITSFDTCTNISTTFIFRKEVDIIIILDSKGEHMLTRAELRNCFNCMLNKKAKPNNILNCLFESFITSFLFSGNKNIEVNNIWDALKEGCRILKEELVRTDELQFVKQEHHETQYEELSQHLEETNAQIEEHIQNVVEKISLQNHQILQRNKEVSILNYIEPKRRYGVKQGKICFEKREGAAEDSRNLENALTKLGYKVNLHESLTKNQTDSVLDSIQQNKNLEFLLLVVLSHGLTEDTFLTSDDAEYSMKSIQYRFTDKKCPHLKGRSKIILSNFCRGQMLEDLAYDSVKVNEESEDRTVPHHMITIHAAHEGFRAAGHKTKGTLFVQKLCEVLNEQQNLEIHKVFNGIYEKMEEANATTPEMKISAPSPEFSF